MLPSCPNCGNALRRPGRFCPTCGAALSRDSESEFLRWRREVGRRQTAMSGLLFMVGLCFLPFFNWTVALIVCGMSGFAFVVGLKRMSRLSGEQGDRSPVNQDRN